MITINLWQLGEDGLDSIKDTFLTVLSSFGEVKRTCGTLRVRSEFIRFLTNHFFSLLQGTLKANFLIKKVSLSPSSSFASIKSLAQVSSSSQFSSTTWLIMPSTLLCYISLLTGKMIITEIQISMTGIIYLGN